jgi:parallel beta-helix repeat protein
MLNKNVVQPVTRFTYFFAFVVLALVLAACSSAPAPSELEVAAAGQVTSFTLINADTDQPISGFDPIPANVTLDLASLPTKQLNIRANTNPSSVGSVRFEFDGNTKYRVQNGAPYSLGGDTGGNYVAWTPSEGSHTLKAVPYSSANASGTAGTSFSLSFKVGSGTSSGGNGGGGVTPDPDTSGGPLPAACGTGNVEDLDNASYGQVRSPSIPQGAVVINPGTNIQSVLNAHASGTAYLLKAGVHRQQSITLAKGDILVGEYGAILDGEGKTGRAIYGNVDAVVRNLEIRNYTADVPAVSGSAGMRIEFNYIHHNYGINVTVSDNVILRNNKITYGGKYGISGYNAENTRLENNELAFNNTRKLSEIMDAGGSKFPGGARYLTICRNYVHDNTGMGLWVDYNGTNISIKENLIVNNTHSGIYYEINGSADIANNVVRGNGKYGIMVSESTSVNVHNNLVENNLTGIALRSACRSVSEAVKNVKVYGNTIKQSQTGTGLYGKASAFWVQPGTCAYWTVSRDAIYNSQGNEFYSNSYTVSNGDKKFYFENLEMTLPTWKQNGLN